MTHYNNKTKLQLIEEIESLKNRIDELEQSELKHNQTEQTIKTKEIKLRNIIEHSTNLFYSHTPDHILTYVSPQTRKFLDCEPEEAKKRWTEFLTENPENEIGFILTNRAIKTGKIQPSYELELVGKKGRKLWVEVNEAPVVEEGQTIAIVGTLTDITDRKLAEEALIESKQMLRDVLNTIPVRVFWKDLDGVYLGCNQLFARDAGRVNPEEVIGDNDDNMGWAEQAELYRSDDRFVIESGQSKINYEEPQTTPEGKTIWLRTSKIPLLNSTGNIYGVLGTYEDITERKKAEEVLLRSEAMFKGIFSQAPVGIELFDSQGNLINANEEALNIFGVKSVEEVKGFKLFEDPNISEEEKIQLRNGLPIDYESEFDFEVVKKFKLYKTSKSGKCFLQVQIVPYNLSDNGERGFVVHVQNITERKLTEEALKGSEERFRRLAENAPDIIYRFRVSPDPGFEFISSAVTKIAGYSPQEYYDDSELGFRIIHPDDRDKLEALYKGIIPEGPHQVRWIRKDGKIIWTEDRTIPIYNEKGEFVAVEGIAREITAQKEAEDALKEAYDIINKSPAIPFLRKNEEGWPVEYVSENVVNLFEYTAEEFMDRKVSYSKIIHPEDLERVENEVTRYSSEEGRDRFSYEPYRIVTKSGNIKWVEDKTYIRRDENKNITHYQGIVEDITTRRLSELAHLESEEKFSKTFNFSPIPMIITEIESGKIVDVNNTFEKLSMYSKQELMGNNIFELNLWANIEHRKDYIKKMKEEKRVSNYEMEIRTRSGDIRESLISGEILIIQGKTYLLTSGIDITERKRIEEALIESKQMLNHVLNTIPVRVFWKDLDGVYLGCDQLFAMDAGRSTPEEVIGDNDDNMGWAEQAELYRSDDRFVIESGQSKINYEEPQTTPEGKTIWLRTSKIPLLNSTGNIYGVLGTYEDITERKLAEEALKESENKFRNLSDNSPNMIFINQEGKIIYANKRCEQYLGYSRDEFYSSHFDFRKLIEPEYLEMMNANFKRHMEGQEVPPVEYAIRTKSGQRIETIINTKLITYGGKQAILGIITDITERKLAEKRIRESHNRLRSLAERLQMIREEERATIAREIHDDLGQSLTAVKMDISWLKNNQGKDKEFTPGKFDMMLDLINSTIQSVKRIATELRPGILDDLGLVPAIEWQAAEFQNRYKIQCNVSINKPEVKIIDEIAIAVFRIFQETLTNVARHSGATKVDVNLNFYDDNKLIMEIADNGVGIEEEQINSLKSLGLFGMRERVNILRGSVEITGEKGKGTKVSVSIPI